MAPKYSYIKKKNIISDFEFSETLEIQARRMGVLRAQYPGLYEIDKSLIRRLYLVNAEKITNTITFSDNLCYIKDVYLYSFEIEEFYIYKIAFQNILKKAYSP